MRALFNVVVFPLRLIVALLNLIRWIVGTVLALFTCTVTVAVIYYFSTVAGS